MSSVLYARLPDTLKEAVRAHAGTGGLSQTRAVVELLEQGLEADAKERARAELEGELARATSERARTQARLREAELELWAAREREQLLASTFAAFAERARGELASCPRCGTPLRGSDLLVSGRCPKCDHALTSLLVPTRLGSLVLNEYLALLGALAVLAGLALRASAERAG